MINVRARVNASQVTTALEAATARVRDLEPANRMASIALYGWTMRNFDSQGTADQNNGIPWAPLAPATIKQKKRIGKEQMLVRTGNLRMSFNPFYDAKVAGVGAQASAFAGEKGDYAQYLHEGTSNMPARNLLPTQGIATEIGIKIYGDHLTPVLTYRSAN